MFMPKINGLNYWEREKPVEFKTVKNVIKVYFENGKVQVFPRCDRARHGIGRGGTISLEDMTIEELLDFRALINEAIQVQLDMKK